MSTPTEDLSAAGVSIWLDDLSRQRIQSGNLAELIESRNVVGVTSNPTIFAGALSNGEAYEGQVEELAAQDATVDEVIFSITTDDVRDACDIFLPVFQATGGVDGRVSIEVSPDLGRDTEATIAQAKDLSARVDRPNILIKIPATKAGLPAITEVIGAGISVNVTLIFSLERYAEVIDAYLAGVEKARGAGHDISTLQSVASFFVSRVDTEVDKRLAAIGTDEAAALKGKAGLANARLAYELYQQKFAEARATELLAAGATLQRLLWASTGVKDPELPDTLYVTELVAPGTVNTMPENTLKATFDHGVITGDTITGAYAEAHEVFDRLAAAGVDVADATQTLEDEGVEKFIASWHELQDTVRTALRAGNGRGLVARSALPHVHIATDHAGFDLSQVIVRHLTGRGYQVTDHGPQAYDPEDDYPEYCWNAAVAVMRDHYARTPSLGIVIGGSGNGEQIAANKVPAIRAALVWDESTARLARQHNDANVIAIGARSHSEVEILRLVDIFLSERFSNEVRHKRRIAQIAESERAHRLT